MPEHTRATADEFVDLFCADPDWVRTEFDAIVAADPTPPQRDRPIPSPGSRPPASAGCPSRPVRRLAGVDSPTVCRSWPWPRSPPPHPSDATRRPDPSQEHD